jgi:hypothetical protein
MKGDLTKEGQHTEENILDGKGRCCGRKPIPYRRPRPHQFCPRCDRDYDEDGLQIENWAWKRDGEGFVSTKVHIDPRLKS